LSATEQQKELALRGGYLPSRKSLYEDREILSEVPAITLGKEAIRNVRSRPATPFYHDMSLAMADWLHPSLAGFTTPEHAAATLRGELEAILEQAKPL
jgi:multiple sugar transport system substrate-binding protein